MIQTRLAPIDVKIKATCVRLRTAKQSMAYGKKHRLMMNSV